MSCLFVSLGRLLDECPQSLRQCICDYLDQNKSIIDGIPTSDLLQMDRADYVKEMRRESTWGGAIEIQCACTLWRLRIMVINNSEQSGPPIEFVPVAGDYQRTLCLCWTGSHYTARTISCESL
jgi:hypothetical protein